MLYLMSSKKISRVKKEEIESNLILFGLTLVLIMAVITFWHIGYKRNKFQDSRVYQKTDTSLLKNADLNQDGKIDEKDAKLIKEAFFKSDSESLKADLNQDGKIDAKDYSLFNKIVNLNNLKEKETNAAN